MFMVLEKVLNTSNILTSSNQNCFIIISRLFYSNADTGKNQYKSNKVIIF